MSDYHVMAAVKALEVIGVQLEAIGTTLGRISIALAQPPPQPSTGPVMPPLPDRCVGQALCGLRDDEARKPRGNFVNRHAWQCAGCGFEGGTSIAM
jgi:hypothetical protein